MEFRAEVSLGGLTNAVRALASGNWAVDTARELRDEMRDRVPKRTRRLHDSIEVEAGSDRWEAAVVIGEPYWKYVNYGTVHQAAQPFVEPAIMEVEQRAIAKIEAMLEID